MFVLHVIQAEFGDCLLLQYGAAGASRFILIDGGPPTVYGNSLRKALQQTVVTQAGKLERVMLSHVDNDHVVGLIDLLTELRLQRTNNQPELVKIERFWHNSFARTQEWEKWLDDHEDEIAAGDVRVMANADKSIPNLSSICVIAAADGKTVLLTGDARSDHILDGLQAKNVLDGAGRAHFDVIKLPHHGSATSPGPSSAR